MEIEINLTKEERTLIKLVFNFSSDEEMVQKIYGMGLTKMKEYLLIEVVESLNKKDQQNEGIETKFEQLKGYLISESNNEDEAEDVEKINLDDLSEIDELDELFSEEEYD